MPRSRFGQRHLATTLGALVLACSVAVLPNTTAGAAGSDGVPLLASMHAVLRSTVGFPVAVDLNLGAPAPATIAADGTVTIPGDGVKFTTDPLASAPVPGTSISRVDVAAVSDVTGWVDTNSREMALQGDFVASLFGSGLEDCPIGPATVSLATTNPDGRAFDADTASATLTTPADFAIPAIAPGAFGCAGQESWLNAALGLGIPGATAIQIDVQFTVPPPPAPPPPPPPPGSVTTPTAAPGPTATLAPAAASPPVPAKISTPARPKPKTTVHAAATSGTNPGPTTTTAAPHEFPTTDPHELLVVPPTDTDSPTTFGRTPIAAAFPVPDKGSDRTSLGIGVLVASLGAGIAGFLLLRSEARKLFRRKRRAAF